tara:strand:+ start:128 stop:301 length:174 start_codon:yes stop_codon:yes gene_type:complete
MKAEVDIKTALTIGGIIAILAGFYYTTQLRLDNIEQEISEIRAELVKTNKLIRRKNK